MKRSASCSARRLGRQLVRRGWMLAVAESCTGGLLGARVTATPGSSAWFAGGVIAYANTAKRRLLGVPAALLAKHGAVSGPVAREMARSVRRRTGAHLGAAITGIAGPTGGTPAKPVGTVWIAVDAPLGYKARLFRFRGGRTRIRRAAVDAAMRMMEAMM